jgi:hypothetical protein
MLLFYSSVARFVASNACRTAGPAALLPPLYCHTYTCPSIIHTIPLPAPFEEIEGDDPGNEKLVAVAEAAAALNVLDAGTNVYALPVAPEPK